MSGTPTIEFDFIVAKIQSMADGSPRIIIDLQEQDMSKAAMLWECKLHEMILHASITVSHVG